MVSLSKGLYDFKKDMIKRGIFTSKSIQKNNILTNISKNVTTMFYLNSTLQTKDQLTSKEISKIMKETIDGVKILNKTKDFKIVDKYYKNIQSKLKKLYAKKGTVLNFY